MADENMTQDPNQQGKKITVKLKPLALEKATGEQAAANVNIPKAPTGASASATVKFDKKAVAASEPEMPTAQDLAKQTIKLTPPPKTGLPKPPAPIPSAAVAPKKATQVVKPVEVPDQAAPPTLKKATQVVKPVEAPAEAASAMDMASAPTEVAPAPAPAPSSTQTVKKPGLSLPKKPTAAADPASAPTEVAPAPAATAAPATEAPKKIGLSLPKKPAAPAPAQEAAPAAPAPAPAPAPAASDADAKKVQEEGLKPREGGGSGLGLKKVEKVAEEDLPDSLKQDGPAIGNANKKIKLKGPADEPGPVFTAIVVLAFIVLLIGVYVQFFSYAKWMPEMDAHINSLPAPPTGVLSKQP